MRNDKRDKGTSKWTPCWCTWNEVKRDTTEWLANENASPCATANGKAHEMTWSEMMSNDMKGLNLNRMQWHNTNRDEMRRNYRHRIKWYYMRWYQSSSKNDIARKKWPEISLHEMLWHQKKTLWCKNPFQPVHLPVWASVRETASQFDFQKLRGSQRLQRAGLLEFLPRCSGARGCSAFQTLGHQCAV